jgi:hypothetical protein
MALFVKRLMSLIETFRRFIGSALQAASLSYFGRENCCAVCGMPIEMKGYWVRTEKAQHHFCGMSCQQAFLKVSERPNVALIQKN